MHEATRFHDIFLSFDLTSGEKRDGAAPMGSSVYLKLKDGRKVSLLANADKEKADALKARLEERVQHGETLVVIHPSGAVEDVTPRGVQLIEVVETPPRTNLDIL
jgi:hypothetical protein